MLSDFFLNHFHVDGVAAFFVQDFAQQAFDDFNGQFLAGQRNIGGHAYERAFEAADIGADAGGQKIHHVVRQRDAHGLGFFIENGLAHFHVRRLQIRDQSPLKTRDQAMFQPLNFAGRPVAGQNDLLMRLVQGVEGMEKFLLDPFLARQKLDVVNQ